MSPLEVPKDAITASEMASTEAPPSSTAQSTKRPNAFAELMAPKPKQMKPLPTASSRSVASRARNVFKNRDGLAAYTEAPESFPPSRVVYYNDDFVCINDLYPKASIHLLIIPRDPAVQLVHPIEALEDPAFLASVQVEVSRAKELVAAELKRKFGAESTSSREHNAAVEEYLSSDDPPSTFEPPAGRDWSLDVRAGIHAHPSMSHLHVHVISQDMHSPCLKHRKHFNSFNTDFFVPIQDFPLTKEDDRRHPGKQGYLNKDLKCWRCKKNFKEKFARLKEHLDEEWEEWRKE